MGMTMFKGKPYGTPAMASQIAYDNSNSGLDSTNVNGAIDELAEGLDDVADEVDTKSANTNLGSVEASTTATAAHGVGSAFIFGGQLVRATSAIAIGDTIAVGTNVEAITILQLIGELNTAIASKQNKLTNPLTQSDVVNALDSTSATLPLSANQGRVLFARYHGIPFSQGGTARTITFSGSARERYLAGFIIIAGQVGVSPPISFMFGGSSVGNKANINNHAVYVSPNDCGVTGDTSGPVIHIANGYGGNWGSIWLIPRDDAFSELTYTYA